MILIFPYAYKKTNQPAGPSQRPQPSPLLVQKLMIHVRTIWHLQVEHNTTKNDIIGVLVSQQKECKPPTLQIVLTCHCPENKKINDEI